MNENDMLLEVTGVSKSFSGVKALDDIKLSVKTGTVHALMGENGAGKSTLMKILTGLYTRDSGEINFEGKALNTSTIQHVIEQGISMIYQELSPINSMTVAENVYCGKEVCKVKNLWIDKRTMEANAQAILNDMGHKDILAAVRMEKLSIAQKQIVEIAKAISNNSKLIIMDEPTSAITETEVELLFDTIKKLKQSGITFIYISHKLDEIFAIADEVTVMRDGKYVDTKSTKEIDSDALVTMMVGRKLSEFYPKEPVDIGEAYLKVSNLCSGKAVKNVSFEAKRGEILGFAGLMGAGRTEIMETIFGVRKADSGEINIGGKNVTINKPALAIKHKIAFITENRRESGCYLTTDLYNNVMMLSWEKVKNKLTGISHTKGKAVCKEQIDLFSIKTRGIKQDMTELSGGNQQKALLSRWLLTEPEIFIMDEPTRGIDVGAKYEIYREIIRLAKEGKCIIIISSEMPELLGMCDRIAVIHEGEISGILNVGDASQEKIMRYAAGLE